MFILGIVSGLFIAIAIDRTIAYVLRAVAESEEFAEN